MRILLAIPVIFLFVSCGGHAHQDKNKTALLACIAEIPSRLPVVADTISVFSANRSTKGMVWIPAGKFFMGASDDEGRDDEYPKHEVSVNGFWMDETEVTNAQFEAFVNGTGYVTTAEKKPDWEELKKQLPPGTPKPSDDVLVASSLVFTPPASAVTLDDVNQWWSWVQGADWRHPQGPMSDIKGKENYPVVHVSWDDAIAYCKWSGKRLPTEAEWEWAARGGLKDNKYPWGNEEPEAGKSKSNLWQGDFPPKNLKTDGFDRTAPVKSFQPNHYKLYDMAGNVWEWCSDYYSDPMEPAIFKKIIKGGSFLCNASYCKGYRVSAKMKTSPDTGLEHTGFRCVK